MFRVLRDLGLEPNVSLHHFTQPQVRPDLWPPQCPDLVHWQPEQCDRACVASIVVVTPCGPATTRQQPATFPGSLANAA
jgi:hypothetical protein